MSHNYSLIEQNYEIGLTQQLLGRCKRDDTINSEPQNPFNKLSYELERISNIQTNKLIVIVISDNNDRRKVHQYIETNTKLFSVSLH
jgi:hypothetical protein